MLIGCQVYVKGSLEAAALYRQAFSAELGYHVLQEDGKGYFHAELEIGGEPFLALSEASGDLGREILTRADASAYPPMNFGVTLPDKDAVDRAYARLAEGGKTLRAPGALPWSDYSTDVVDRFGVYWYLTVVQHRPEEE